MTVLIMHRLHFKCANINVCALMTTTTTNVKHDDQFFSSDQLEIVPYFRLFNTVFSKWAKPHLFLFILILFT